MRTTIIALGRSVGLLCLAVLSGLVCVATLVAFLPAFGLGIVLLIPWPVETGRHFTNLVRRVCSRWCGVTIPVPYHDAPFPPLRRPDGLYERDGSLHRHAWWPAMSARIEWALGDRATGKDLVWLLANPIVGGAVAGFPVALVGFGAWAAITGRWFGLLAVPVGFAIAPAAVRLYGRWCRALLAPTSTARLAAIAARRTWFRQHLLALVKLPAVAAVGLVAFGAVVVAWIGIVLTFTIGQVFAFAPVIDLTRRVAGLRRALANEWEGTAIGSPYLPAAPLIVEADGRFRVGKNLFRTKRWANWNERQQRYYRDPATWRDVLSATIEPITGVVIALIPPAMWVWAMGWVIADAFAEMRHLSVAVIVVRVLAGLVLLALPVVIAPTLLRWHGRFTSTLLAPTEKARLALEVARLTETRADAIEVQAAEVRRIERDLHDGAQARLIAVGLTLGLAERSVDTDPAATRALIVAAREASETALIELRDLVRGIHPPVLAERGLGDAIRALALDCPLRVDVTVDIPGALPAPVESAAYFAVGETIANAVRHAYATGIDVELTWREGRLAMTVTDDGRGGADPAGGTGLAGITRRLGTFDGTVAIVSPPGGPTEIKMELPCESSSPKTLSC